MAPRSSNQFSILDSGDVEILLTRKPEHRLLLHSAVLGLHSTWFKASLSERWAKDMPSSQSDVKWSYELRFDNADETAALVKRSTAVVTSKLMSTDPPINTYFNKGIIPEAGLTSQQFEARNGLVRAYRCYFGVMFYEPLDEFIDSNPIDSNPDKALHFLHEVAKIADYYDSPLAITCHAENFLNRKAMAYRYPIVRFAPVLLQISLKLKSGPLLKDAICRLAGDETREDNTIGIELDPRMSSLVLQKRDSLRQMMREIDLGLVGFRTDDDEGYSEDRSFVTACFRQFIAKRIFDQDAEEWPSYASKYRKLVADVSRMKVEKRFFGRHFSCSHSEKAAHLLYGKYYWGAIEILWPLFTSYLSNRVRYTPQPWTDGSADLYEGFTCVRVFDKDLPWKIS